MGEGLKLESEVKIHNKVIKEIKDNQKKENIKNIELTEEIKNLLRDIDQLENNVYEKEELLENIQNENISLKEKLLIMEEKNIDKNSKRENLSFLEEVKQSNRCKICEHKFEPLLTKSYNNSMQVMTPFTKLCFSCFHSRIKWFSCRILYSSTCMSGPRLTYSALI